MKQTKLTSIFQQKKSQLSPSSAIASPPKLQNENDLKDVTLDQSVLFLEERAGQDCLPGLSTAQSTKRVHLEEVKTRKRKREASKGESQRAQIKKRKLNEECREEEKSDPKLVLSQLSKETQAMLKRIKKRQNELKKLDNLITESSSKKDGRDLSISEIPLELFQEPEPMESQVNMESMKLKHRELLKEERELVLPLDYKKLLQMQELLDKALFFLKECRKATGAFSEVKKSIESMCNKKFEVNTFRQILTVVPEFYSHRWEPQRFSEHQLVIDFPESLGESSPYYPKDGAQLAKRNQIFKQRLLERTKQYHDQHLKTVSRPIDAYKSQMWHHSFDPHSQPAVPMADLKPFPTKFTRSESVNSFLSKSQLTEGIIKQALTNTAQSVPKAGHSQLIEQKGEEDKNDGLKELSAKTGLSVSTLMIIKARENAIKEHNKSIDKSIRVEEGKKDVQGMISLAEKIRSIMTFKKVQTMFMRELVASLGDKDRAQFISQNDLVESITKLEKVVPEWIQVKQVGAGKIVKVNNGMFQNEAVQNMIKQRQLRLESAS